MAELVLSPRLWRARRKKEAKLWNRLVENGLLLPEAVELNRMVAEDIKYLRSKDWKTIRFQTGEKLHQWEAQRTIDQWAHQLEDAYLRTDGVIERAKADLRKQGIPIPEYLAHPPLAPKEEEEEPRAGSVQLPN